MEPRERSDRKDDHKEQWINIAQCWVCEDSDCDFFLIKHSDGSIEFHDHTDTEDQKET